MNDLLHAIDNLGVEILITLILSFCLIYIGRRIDVFLMEVELKNARYNEKETTERNWRHNFWQGISTEFVGAGITALLFGVILLIFQQYQSIQNDKADLILQMASPDNSFAIEAVRIARHKGWLEDGTFSGTRLSGANLFDAHLLSPNLSDVNLNDANLESVNLIEANLENATFLNANMKETQIVNSNLRGAVLINTDLTGAFILNTIFLDANLAYTNLKGAYLQNVNLENVTWILNDNNPNQVTILPDGTEWNENVDLEKFTDPGHPDYVMTYQKIEEIRREMNMFVFSDE